jgi:cobalt-precorrin-5B (C1)-methyltransferase
MKNKDLRSGYTTGACAAAAAKAAVKLLLGGKLEKSGSVEIPFPDGSRVIFKVRESEIRGQSARAFVVKDAGDDPDITDGADIGAEASMMQNEKALPLIIKGGIGVGMVTKPGLPVPVGEPAINPVPRQMIEQAVNEAINESAKEKPLGIEVTISVPDGEELVKKTLNARLGIVGGISILGTTGIVKPVSTEAWTATITSSMDVAKAMGHKEIVLSAGRTSERAHLNKYNLPEEAYVLIGDYLEFSLREAEKHKFKKIILCAQWAKLLKIAMATPQTHVRFGAIDIKKAVKFLNSLSIDIPREYDFNTAREIFDHIIAKETGMRRAEFFQKVCNAAKKYAREISVDTPVETCLVSYEREIIAVSE